MGATEEQMDLVADSGLDHVSYLLILYSLAFLTFLFVNMLINVYDRAANADDIAAKMTGRVRLNGHVPSHGVAVLRGRPRHRGAPGARRGGV